MYVVAGVTGHTGKAVAEALLAKGAPLRVIVRSEEKGAAWKKRGAEVAVSSLEDAGALNRTLAGASGAYLLLPPNYTADDFLDAMRQTADALGWAARASNIAHVVFLSSVGAQLPSGTGPIQALRYAESALGPAARNLTLLRPSYFMENWSEAVQGVLADGALHSFFPAGFAFPMIATADIGRIAADSLLAPASGRRILELEGPQDYSPEDIAAAFAAATRRPVHVAVHPLEAMIPALTSAGLKPGIAALLAEMTGAIASGYVRREGGRCEFRRGTVRAEDAIAAMLPQHATR